MFSCEYREIFKNIFFHRTPPEVVYGCTVKWNKLNSFNEMICETPNRLEWCNNYYVGFMGSVSKWSHWTKLSFKSLRHHCWKIPKIINNLCKNKSSRPEVFCKLKKRHWHRCFFCEFCEISKNTFFYRTPPVAAYVKTKEI